jgi:MFS family permease
VQQSRGGSLAEHLSWWWTFWVEIPIGIAAPVITDRCRLCDPRRRHPIDWLEAFFIVAGIGALLPMLSLAGKEFAWNSAWTFGLTAAALVMLAARVCQEGGTVEPIMPPRLFTNCTFVITSRADFVVGVAMFGAVIFLPSTRKSARASRPPHPAR